MDRPSIVEVVGRYVALHRVGKEFVGLCPFHDDRHPSFSVNPDKQVFYCHPCAIGGDVIAFIQKIEGLDFNSALSHLGMGREKISSQEVTRRMTIKAASDSLALWASDVSNAIGGRMREAGSHAAIAAKVLRELPGADEKLLLGEIEVCEREWSLLEILQEDLFNPAFTFDLWRNREAIEGIAERAA